MCRVDVTQYASGVFDTTYIQVQVPTVEYLFEKAFYETGEAIRHSARGVRANETRGSKANTAGWVARQRTFTCD